MTRGPAPQVVLLAEGDQMGGIGGSPLAHPGLVLDVVEGEPTAAARRRLTQQDRYASPVPGEDRETEIGGYRVAARGHDESAVRWTPW